MLQLALILRLLKQVAVGYLYDYGMTLTTLY